MSSIIQYHIVTSSLSNLIQNFVEGFHKIKYKNCNSFFEYESVNEGLINYKSLS